jgi:hypothetical protein
MTDTQPSTVYVVGIFHKVDDSRSDQIKTLGPFNSYRQAEKVELALNINLNHADYYTEIGEAWA